MAIMHEGNPERLARSAHGRHEMNIWLNWACLGEASSSIRRCDLRTREKNLLEALRTCISWVASWTKRLESEIFLTGSATEACDMLLRIPTEPQPHSLITTDHVFGSIGDAVARYSHWLGAATGKPVAVRVVPIDPLLSLPSEDFARHLGTALKTITAGAPSVLVVEHVTSRFGLTLPVHLIQEELESIDCRLIVDAAQSAGVLSFQTSRSKSQFGCFHKYLNCPAGTGFGVLADEYHAYLPSSAITIAKLSGAIGDLPTQAADRWIDCAHQLVKTNGSENVLECLQELRHALTEELDGFLVPMPMVSDHSFDSHILAFDLGTVAAARTRWQRLDRAGFRTRLDGRFLRISLHHSISLETIKLFARTLKAD